MFEQGLRKIAFSLCVVLTDWVRAAAEGKKGPKAKAIYWTIAGWKRYIAAVLGVGGVVTAALGYTDVGLYLGTAGGILFGLGFLDKEWRSESPAELFQFNRAYRFLADRSATITSLLATAAYFVDHGYALGGPQHAQLELQILVGLGAALAYLGCADAAWRARPPAFSFPVAVQPLR